jgi:hypothetical protein
LGYDGYLLGLADGIYDLSHEFQTTSNGGFANLANRGECLLPNFTAAATADEWAL